MFNDLVAENATMFPPLHEANLHIFLWDKTEALSVSLIQNLKTVCETTVGQREFPCCRILNLTVITKVFPEA